MRVLVMDEWIPLPLNSGKRIRTFQLLSPYARQHDIVYLCYADRGREAAKIAQMEDAGFRVVCVPPLRKFDTPLKLALGFGVHCFGRLPLAVHKHHSRGFAETLRDLLARERFDLIHCEWTHYAQYLGSVEDTPRFLSSHNVECMQWQRLYEVERNPLRRGALYLEWRKMRAFERRAVSACDHVAAVSAADGQLLQDEFGARSVQVIPNGVDLERYKRVECNGRDDVLAYCASMDSFANQDAVLYFVRQILPRIWKRRPQVRFMIIGRCPPRAIRNLANDRILVEADVQDVRLSLAQAALCVIPLRVAGGSRLKILEAFAAGIPVVSTSIGAEGLDVEPGRHLLIADHEDVFAAETIRLLDDRALARRLAIAGRTLVEEHYDWKTIAPRLQEAWERTIENFSARHHEERHGDSNCAPAIAAS